MNVWVQALISAVLIGISLFTWTITTVSVNHVAVQTMENMNEQGGTFTEEKTVSNPFAIILITIGIGTLAVTLISIIIGGKIK